MTGNDERRCGVRVDFNNEITIKVDSGRKHYNGNSRDISLRGIFLCTSDMLEINAACDIEVRLDGGADNIVLYLKGHVVRKESEGYAIYFDSVDLDSYTHLKNIVKYNSPDTKTGQA